MEDLKGEMHCPRWQVRAMKELKSSVCRTQSSVRLGGVGG